MIHNKKAAETRLIVGLLIALLMIIVIVFTNIEPIVDLFGKTKALVQCGGQFEGVCLPACPDGMEPWGLDSGAKSTCSKQENLDGETDDVRKAFLVEQGLSESTINAKDWAKDRRYWTTCCVKNTFTP